MTPGAGWNAEGGGVGQPIHFQKEIANVGVSAHGRQIQVDHTVLVHVNAGGFPMIEQPALIGIEMVGAEKICAPVVVVARKAMR